MKFINEQINQIIENYRKITDYPKMEYNDGCDGYIWVDFGIMEIDFDCSLEELESEINQKLATIDGLEFDTQIECGPVFYLNYKMLVNDKTDYISNNEKLLDNAINVIKEVLKNRKAIE